MISVVDLEYKIEGLGTFEQTKIEGLSEKMMFSLGNMSDDIVVVEVIEETKVYLDLSNVQDVFLESGSILKLKMGDEIELKFARKPSPTIKIKINNIYEKEKEIYI